MLARTSPQAPPPGARRPALTIGSAYARPATVTEALRLLAQDTPWRILAGGTDLLVRHEHHLQELHLLDITAIAELSAIAETGRSVVIPALATYSDLRASPIVRRWAGPLATAAALGGGRQIQNAGTLAGNIVNASPAGDGIPSLYVMAARVHVRSAGGSRVAPIREFFTGPGRTRLGDRELVTHVEIPETPQTDMIQFFDRVGTRRAQAITKASIAFRARPHEGGLTDVAIALGAVGPTVLEAPETAAFLERGPLTEQRLRQAADLLSREARPIDDVRSTARYRRQAVAGLLNRNLLSHTTEATDLTQAGSSRCHLPGPRRTRPVPPATMTTTSTSWPSPVDRLAQDHASPPPWPTPGRPDRRTAPDQPMTAPPETGHTGLPAHQTDTRPQAAKLNDQPRVTGKYAQPET
ncbi:FAD binding domain-containing protein [Nonomuraea sp. NPDC002799]